jgi:NAD(P)-dependent dehydrogenase (short-subunit alcohol dehydrogenase family)
VVTGASRGIGLAITRGLAGHGAYVIAGARRSSAELDQLAKEGQVRVLEVDLADQGLDILVNNVGGAPARTGGFLSITDEDWQASLTLNLMAAVRATRSALPAMLAAGKGSTTARPRPRWLASARPCPRKWGVAASGSIRSARARWPPTCGWATRESRRP